MDPATLKFTREHEWIGLDGGEYVVGITAYAQEQLGDITFVELPKIGRKLKQKEAAAVVESVKAASDIYAPVAGETSAVNEALETTPELINQSPLEDGWIFRMKDVDTSHYEALMDLEQYEDFLAENA